jgi:hypothetical protein
MRLTARHWRIRPGISIIRVTRTVKSSKRRTPSGLSPCGISLQGRNSRTIMAMMPAIIRRIRATEVLRTAVGISWLRSIGVGSHTKDTPQERPACRRSRRVVPAITSALQTSHPCRRVTHEGQRLPCFALRPISGYSTLYVLFGTQHPPCRFCEAGPSPMSQYGSRTISSLLPSSGTPLAKWLVA